MILSILYRATPEDVRLILVDPKMLELSLYEGIPHLYHPVVTQPREAAHVLKWAVGEMRGRYQLMMENGVRHIDAFNQFVENGRGWGAGRRRRGGRRPGEDPVHRHRHRRTGGPDDDERLPAGVEDSITQLTQMARAAGIHLVFATQRPSVDVLTGVIKANFPRGSPSR
jgi:S-DNA-T family DNA segregation ATPase FtsK/SpoIIIE